ncbi:MAG: metal-dependent transcriptional regulator [Negativicutes bacterium]|nr:metal-dependent transcriptional regulator [Negativicutes bacterium]
MIRKLSISLEDYLEAIFLLGRDNGAVRLKELAGRLRVAKASAHGAVKILAGRGLIEHRHYDVIRLTECGAVYAARLFDKHRLLARFLTEVLALDTGEAQQAACSMEHHLPDSSLPRLQQLLAYMAERRDWPAAGGFSRAGGEGCDAAG